MTVMASPSPSKYTTLLRLKRRRIDPPLAPTLQVPITSIKKNEETTNNNPMVCRPCTNNNAIFIQLTQEENALDTNNIYKKKRKLNSDNSFVRVVDCYTTTATGTNVDVLPQDQKDSNVIMQEDEDEEEYETNKKRKVVSLKITNCQNIDLDSTKKKSKNNKSKKSAKKKPQLVLNPFLRLMDTYLQQYHESGPSIVNIIDTYLENFMRESKNDCLNMCCSNGMGSILHGAALWNDNDTVTRALALNINVHLKDNDSRTAYQIANLVGNNSIMELLYDYDSSVANYVNEDEYVYDIYCLKDDDTIWENNTDTTSKDASASLSATHNVELLGGKGYFNDFNEFVVELDDDDDDKITNKNNEFKNDDDEDSNDEGYYANDYPDEEDDDNEEEKESQDYIEGQGYEKNWNDDGEEEENLDYNDDYY